MCYDVNGMGRATLTEIARRCNVSHGTVSRVLNERLGATFSVRPELRDQILSVARQLNYRPNGAALAMSRGRFHNVSLVLGTSSHYLPLGLVLGASQALRQRDMSLSVVELSEAELTSEGYVPRMLRELACDGLLINYLGSVPREMDRLLETYRVPSVWVNVRRDHDCVFPDDYQGGCLATRALLERGHRRITFVGVRYPHEMPPAAGHYSETDRVAGYSATMREAGLQPHVMITRCGAPDPLRPGDDDNRLSLIDAELSRPDRPTALVAVTPRAAQPALVVAPRRGLRVPQDLSLITFGDWIADDAGVRLDMVATRMDRVAANAVAALSEKIEQPLTSLPPTAVMQELWPGSTLGDVGSPTA